MSLRRGQRPRFLCRMASPYLEYKRLMTYSRSSDRGATETTGLCIRK
jgi:hypothetical protein